MMKLEKLAAFLALLICLSVQVDGAKLMSKVNQDGTYMFAAGSNTKFYLESGDTFLHAMKMFYSTSDGTLKLMSNKTITGTDTSGSYTGTVFSYTGSNTTKMENQILIYNDGEFVRFTQSFPVALMNTNASSHDDSLSSFPSFKIGDGLKMAGYINMFDNMCGYGFNIANISSSSKFIRSGQRAGPFVLFDSMGNTMVISAFSNFMAHNMMFNSTSGQLQFGIMGGVTAIPAHYQIDTILYYGSDGINKAIESWGEVLTKRYGKSRMYRDNDFTINYLGYWTDNGAFYYYNTEPKKNYQTTILDVLQNAKMSGIPYRYVQYDSWWYYKGVDDGVKNWTARPDVFPNGSSYLFEQHGLPVAAHNRYWGSDTTYATANGGRYNFIVEREKAIPNDVHFWGDLLHNSTKWGLIMYEQDWLDREFELMEATHTSISLGREWLIQMGKGAAESHMTVQYCMALSRHMLQSVEIPVVTQARVSGDYQPGNDQWRIGITSMFANAIHLAPFKDTFWTTSHQAGSEYPDDEKYPQLQAAIATLSTGPVGPSDKIGSASVGLILQSCRADGLILKPSRPATMIDQHIIDIALPGMVTGAMANPDAQIYTTYTDLWYSSMAMRHGILLATDLSANYPVYPKSFYLDTMGNGTSHIAYRSHPVDDPKLYTFDESTPLSIPKCGRSDFQMWYTSPVISMSGGAKVAILGERGKWVPVSRQRISHIEHKGDNLLIDLEGAPFETIVFGFSVNAKVQFINCRIPVSGKSRISLNSKTCFDA